MKRHHLPLGEALRAKKVWYLSEAHMSLDLEHGIQKYHPPFSISAGSDWIVGLGGTKQQLLWSVQFALLCNNIWVGDLQYMNFGLTSTVFGLPA